MADTIESFVQKLQADGVQAGQQEAEKIRQAAQKEAEQVLQQAKEQAERIVADAEGQARAMLDKGKTELQLAARDAALKLRDALGRAVEAILTEAAEDKLSDVAFLGEILHELVAQYAKSHLAGEAEALIINVRPEMKQKLKDWALGELGHKTVDQLRTAFDLEGTLASSGFEYKISGATVEVTVESVVQTLKELLSPAMAEMLDAVLAENKQEG